MKCAERSWGYLAYLKEVVSILEKNQVCRNGKIQDSAVWKQQLWMAKEWVDTKEINGHGLAVNPDTY